MTQKKRPDNYDKKLKINTSFEEAINILLNKNIMKGTITLSKEHPEDHVNFYNDLVIIVINSFTFSGDLRDQSFDIIIRKLELGTVGETIINDKYTYYYKPPFAVSVKSTDEPLIAVDFKVPPDIRGTLTIEYELKRVGDDLPSNHHFF